MKDKFRQFPLVLQKQILIRLTAGIVSLLMLVIILLYRGGIELMFPCIGFSSVFFISALHLFARCDEKNYVHRLLHATNAETIQILLSMLNLTTKQKAKVNYYREKAGLVGI